MSKNSWNRQNLPAGGLLTVDVSSFKIHTISCNEPDDEYNNMWKNNIRHVYYIYFLF